MAEGLLRKVTPLSFKRWNLSPQSHFGYQWLARLTGSVFVLYAVRKHCRLRLAKMARNRDLEDYLLLDLDLDFEIERERDLLTSFLSSASASEAAFATSSFSGSSTTT